MTVALGVLVGLVGGMLAAVAISLFSQEARAWLPHLSQLLIRSAARQLDDEGRDRYEDEWLAELAEWSDRPLSALAKTAHIRWTAREMRATLADVRLRGMRTKRALDVLIASSVLLFLAPLIIVIAVAIKIESPGPLFVRSERIGRHDKWFTMLRFRTIAFDGSSRARHRCDEFPDLTRCGALLHRTFLDELPRLINVLRGQMSVVGPVPLPPELPRPRAAHGARSELRPGLVSLAALADARVTSYDELMRLDHTYARTRSVGLDLKLLARCVVVFFRRLSSP